MGFKDLIASAQIQANREGDYLLPNQRGTMVTKSVEMLKGQGGKFAVILGKIVSVSPKIAGEPTQAIGSMGKIWIGFYGSAKKVAASISNLKNHTMAITGCPESEVAEALTVIFGDDPELMTESASDKARAHPGFRGAGVLVDFETSQVKDKVDPTKSYDRVKLINRKAGNSPKEILARKAELGL